MKSATTPLADWVATAMCALLSRAIAGTWHSTSLLQRFKSFGRPCKILNISYPTSRLSYEEGVVAGVVGLSFCTPNHTAGWGHLLSGGDGRCWAFQSPVYPVEGLAVGRGAPLLLIE